MTLRLQKTATGSVNPAGSQQRIHGNWELDLNASHLYWSPEQYKVYGYEPNELVLNDEYFIINTTHPSDIERITGIVHEALRKHEGYMFKRRIIKKSGVLGFVETKATIIRSKNGIPGKIIGTTCDVKGECENGLCDYSDPTFFNAFYINYKKAITAEICRWTFDSALSKDLCQEVFLKAWHNMSRYDATKGELYTWLINIARNHCKDYLRSKYFRYQQLTSNYEFAAEEAYGENSPDIKHLCVRDLLFRLPLDLGEIVELLFVQGFTQTETAKLKAMPLGTVKSKSRAAIRLLREFLSAPQNAAIKEEFLFF